MKDETLGKHINLGRTSQTISLRYGVVFNMLLRRTLVSQVFLDTETSRRGKERRRVGEVEVDF